MSLRGFHILFIALSALIVAGFAVWCFTAAGAYSPVMGASAGACALVIAGYGLLFIRRSVGAAEHLQAGGEAE